MLRSLHSSGESLGKNELVLNEGSKATLNLNLVGKTDLKVAEVKRIRRKKNEYIVKKLPVIYHIN